MISAETPLTILLEMRPALEGHAGIPQEARLLFRGLSLLGDGRVEGLLQKRERLRGPGLPPGGNGWAGPLPADQQLNRLGRLVITLEQRTWQGYLNAVVHTIGMAFWHAFGGRAKARGF